MNRLAQILGFDKRKLWWYRDIGLTTIAAIMTLWVLTAVLGKKSAFNRYLLIGAFVIAILCWAITPNRLLLVVAVMGIVALQGWFAVLFSGDPRSWWIAIPATVLALGLFLRYRKKPIIPR